MFSVPEQWNEMSQKQLLEVMRVMHAQKGDDQGVLMLFRAMVDIPWHKFFAMRTPALMDVAIECTEFLFQKNTLTRNLIPQYKWLAGPADNLMNLKMAEFCFSEFRYFAWRNSQEQKDLDMFIATLYRPTKDMFYDAVRNPDGDVRKPFNDSLTPVIALKIAKWPMEVKRAIVLFYEGCRAKKIEDNPKVFDNSTGEESLHGLWSVMRSVAKGGSFGDFDKVNEQYVDTILMELNETVAEAERIEMEQNRVTVNT